MAASSAEQAVLGMFNQSNKPYSVQNLVDFLAHAGHKKAAIGKALDSLVEQGKIVVKEFGKTKLYIPNQSGNKVLSKEELDELKASLTQLTNQLREEQEANKKLEQELASWRNSMPVADMQQEIGVLKNKLPVLKAKAAELQKGSVLVSEADRAAAEKALTAGLEQWRKRKSIFRNIWDSISDTMEGRKEADLLEEMGVDTDEAIKVSMKALEALVPSRSCKSAHLPSSKKVKR